MVTSTLIGDMVCYPVSTHAAVAIAAATVVAGLVIVTLVWGANKEQ